MSGPCPVPVVERHLKSLEVVHNQVRRSSVETRSTVSDSVSSSLNSRGSIMEKAASRIWCIRFPVVAPAVPA